MVSKELILLKIIDMKGNLNILIEQGFTYGQIAVMIQQQTAEGNVYSTESAIELTEKGKQYLKDHFKKIGYKDKDMWILPQAQYYCEPISIEEVILP